MPAARLTALALIVASASCSLFTDTGGLTSTNAAENEAGTEAGAISDAAADVGVDAEAGSSAACPTGAKLCLDFDTDPYDKGAFHDVNDPSSLIEPSTAHVVSPSRGMRVAIANPSAVARLQVPVPADARHTRLSFSVWIDPPAISPSQRISIGELVCQRQVDGGSTYFMGAFLFLEHSNLAIRGSTNTLLYDLPRQRFARVVLDVVWRANDGDAEVTVDGTSLGKGALSESCVGQGNWRVVVGISTGGISSPVEAFYDDVVFEAE